MRYNVQVCRAAVGERSGGPGVSVFDSPFWVGRVRRLRAILHHRRQAEEIAKTLLPGQPFAIRTANPFKSCIFRTDAVRALRGGFNNKGQRGDCAGLCLDMTERVITSLPDISGSTEPSAPGKA